LLKHLTSLLAEDFDLDSIELEPMRAENAAEMPAQQNQAQSQQQHPGTPTAPPQHHYYPQQQQPQGPNYPASYGSPSAAQQQFVAQQNYQIQQQQQQQQHYQQIQKQQRDQQTQRDAQARAEQQKKEQQELEIAMQRAPDDPYSPTDVEVPIQEQQKIMSTIEHVVEIMKSDGDKGDSSTPSTSSLPTPPPAKRAKKQPNAKTATRAQQQQVAPLQTMPPQGQFVGYGQTPGTPTAEYSPAQQQQFHFHQQRMYQQVNKIYLIKSKSDAFSANTNAANGLSTRHSHVRSASLNSRSHDAILSASAPATNDS
jgi:hypothetical protein